MATRVPDHLALVLAAIATGKHVHSEWPLGRSSTEATEMSQAAKAAGVHDMIGLQLHGSPTFAAARHHLADGSIGRALSVRAYSSTAGFDPEVAPQLAYLEDPASFANLATIQGAHTLDLLLALAGPVRPRLSEIE